MRQAIIYHSMMAARRLSSTKHPVICKASCPRLYGLKMRGATTKGQTWSHPGRSLPGFHLLFLVVQSGETVEDMMELLVGVSRYQIYKTRLRKWLIGNFA